MQTQCGHNCTAHCPQTFINLGWYALKKYTKLTKNHLLRDSAKCQVDAERITYPDTETSKH